MTCLLDRTSAARYPSPMGTPCKSPAASDVPTQVFESFIESLEKKNLPVETIGRIKKTLLEDRQFTDAALKSAVLGDEPLQ